MKLGPAVFLLAHPGHELFLYGWMQQLRPLVCVLTDGSGRSRKPRIEVTRAIVGQAGGTPGSVFGAIEDRVLYDLVLEGQTDFFSRLVERIADMVVRQGVHCVVADALERRLLAHDLCHELVRSAIALAARRTQRSIPCFDFPIYGYYGAFPLHAPSEPLTLTLEPDTFAAKVHCARSLPGNGLRQEIDQLIELRGLDWFRREELRPIGASAARSEPEVPWYEHHGEQLLATGKVERVIRYREHVLPLLEAVRRSVALPDSASTP